VIFRLRKIAAYHGIWTIETCADTSVFVLNERHRIDDEVLGLDIRNRVRNAANFAVAARKRPIDS